MVTPSTSSLIVDLVFILLIIFDVVYNSFQINWILTSFLPIHFAVFLVVADESTGRSVPFVFLERVKDDFKKRYGSSIKNDGDPHPLADDEEEDDDLFGDRFSIAYNLDREFGYVYLFLSPTSKIYL